MSAPAPPDDARTLAAVARGEPEAVDAWYRSEHPQVYRLCFGFLADATEAEDIAQDAMLKLLDQIDRWDPRRGWSSWRNTIVLNLCRDRLRRRATRRTAESAAPHASLSRPLPRPDELADASELRAVIVTALEALNPREREAFVLHDLQGHDTAETADALGITASSVRSLLTLARRRLRRVLGDRAPELVPSGGTHRDV